jgi:hypothetical protein
MSTAKEHAVIEIMQLCDALRNIADKFETFDSAVTELGFKSNGTDPIVLNDLSAFNVSIAHLTDAFKVVKDYNSLINGGAITPEDLKTKLDALKYWRK